MSAYDQCLVGDVRAVLPTLDAGSVQCVVTSPPFWGLRDYGYADQIGMEPVPDCLGWATGEPCGACYVCTMVGVCRELRRVLRDDGTMWIEIGDSFANDGKWGGSTGGKHASGVHGATSIGRAKRTTGLKPKDLCGIPWRVALALQADGWFLRADIVWARPNPMPESVQDRPTKAHSYLFLLTKRPTYYYDPDAIREPHKPESVARYEYGLHLTPDPDAIKGSLHERVQAGIGQTDRMGDFVNPAGRNARSVWTIATRPYFGAHFACWPPELVKRCILAGTSEAGCCAACGAPRARVTEREATGRVRERAGGGLGTEIRRAPQGLAPVNGTFQEGVVTRTIGWRPTCACDAPSAPCLVLDPFMGSGTTAKVAQDLGRRWLGVELNPTYVDLQTERAAQQGLPLLAPCLPQQHDEQ